MKLEYFFFPTETSVTFMQLIVRWFAADEPFQCSLQCLSLRICLGWSVLDEPFYRGRSAVMHYIEKHFHQSDRLRRGVELLLSLWDYFSVWWIGSYTQSVITELLLHAGEFLCWFLC